MELDLTAFKKPEAPKLYRYVEIHHNGYSRIYLEEYDIIKTTPQGYWIDFGKKWVSNNRFKRFAYPTILEALTNFVKRKQSEIKILESRLACAESALALTKEYLDTNNPEGLKKDDQYNFHRATDYGDNY